MKKKIEIVVSCCGDCPYHDFHNGYYTSHICKLLKVFMTNKEENINKDILPNCPLADCE
jgi:hypothetical protein